MVRAARFTFLAGARTLRRLTLAPAHPRVPDDPSAHPRVRACVRGVGWVRREGVDEGVSAGVGVGVGAPTCGRKQGPTSASVQCGEKRL